MIVLGDIMIPRLLCFVHVLVSCLPARLRAIPDLYRPFVPFATLPSRRGGVGGSTSLVHTPIFLCFGSNAPDAKLEDHSYPL